MIDLEFPDFISATPAYLDKGGVLNSPLGGDDQRLNRLGNRHQITYAVEFEADEEFRRFAQKLRRAQTEGARVRFVQVGLAIGHPGAPQVDGAVAGGTSLPLKGLTPAYAVREGQFLSIIRSGRRYLHSVDAEAIADASGDAVLTITPELRISLAGNETVEIAAPKIEGLLDGDQVQWEHAVQSHSPLIFTVKEIG